MMSPQIEVCNDNLVCSHLLRGLGLYPATARCEQTSCHKFCVSLCFDIPLCRSLALKVASACRLPDSLINRAEHHYSVRNAAQV
jgi:hypothetical protein